MSDDISDDYDGPWKEALDVFFEHFLLFFFPAVHAGIDWGRGIEFPDTELRQLTPESEHGRRTVDKLAKVWLKSGEQQCIFVHAELQGQPEKEFSERLFVYNYRIFDKFRLPVVTLAVLTDKSDGKWCNPEFGYRYFGCDMRFSFPLAKLTDLRLRIAELENSENPLSVVVLAHLATQDTRRDYDKRLLSKVEMVRILLRKGFSREVVRELFRLMDWLLYLPEQYKQLYFQKVQKIQEETAMQFVDCFEERGIAKGIEKGIAKGIEKGIEKGTELGIKRGRVEALQNLILENLVERFNAIVQPLTESIRNQTDMIKLRQLANASITVQSLSEFETLLAKS